MSEEANKTEGIKYLPNPAQFLIDSGLLFEINRRVLHPLGMALQIILDGDDACIVGCIWDYREDPEGIVFNDEAFQAGIKKLNKFMTEFGNKKFKERYERLGFIIQGEE